MDQQEQARRSLAESFRHERAEIEAKERAHPPKNQPRWLRWIQQHTAWVVGLVALLVIAVPFTFVAVHLFDSFGIADTVKQFCVAAADHDYAKAYGYLSAGAQRRIGRDAFATSATGTLGTCDLAEKAYWSDVQGDKATVRVRFSFKSGDTDLDGVGTVTLVRENRSWRLDTLDDLVLPFFLPASS